MCQHGYITPAFSASSWWGEINLERSVCGGKEHKKCDNGWKWVKLGENAISPMWKNHQNLLSNNNDAQGITKYGFLVWPHAQIGALHFKGPHNCSVNCKVLRAWPIGPPTRPREKHFPREEI